MSRKKPTTQIWNIYKDNLKRLQAAEAAGDVHAITQYQHIVQSMEQTYKLTTKEADNV